MRLAAIIVALSCASGGRADSVVIWPETWPNGNNHAYQRIGEYNSARSWSEAIALAASTTPPEGYGPGHLVSLGSKEEHDWIFRYGPKTYEYKIWLGITDEAVAGEWRWLDGSPGVWQDPKIFANPIQTLPFAAWRSGSFYGEESLPPYDLTSATRSYGATSYLYDHPGAPIPYQMTWNTRDARGQEVVVIEFEPLPVPEPSTFVLAGIAAVGLGWRWRSRT